MQQYFLNECANIFDRVELNEEQSHHIAHVMRMKEGQEIRVVCEDERVFLAKVEFENKKVYAKLVEELEDSTKNAVSITLLQGVIKKDKWDFLLQKCAELGVDEIVPFTSSRTVVKAKEEKVDKKLIRWNKILTEACEQCKRSSLVQLQQPCTLKESVAYKKQLNLIAYEDADFTSEKLSTILLNNTDVESVCIAIGPEGGFSKEEVAYFQDAGFHRVSLGSRILRAETAAMSSIATISFFYDMKGDDK